MGKEYITIDELRKIKPKMVSSEMMEELATRFQLATSFASSCELGKMTEDLMWVGESIDNILDEAQFALRHKTMTGPEYDEFIRKLEEFQHGTVVKAIKDTLVEKCNCKLA